MPDQFKKFAMIKIFSIIQNSQCHQAFLEIRDSNLDKSTRKTDPVIRKLNSVVTVEIQHSNSHTQNILYPETVDVQKYEKKNRIKMKTCKASWDIINKFERFDDCSPTYNNVPEMRKVLAQQTQDRQKIRNHSQQQQINLRSTNQKQIALYHPVFILFFAFLIYLASSIQQNQL